MENPENKLHIDENWKDQVEREKEAAKAKVGATQSASAGAPPATTDASSTSPEESARRHAAETTGEEQPFGEPAGDRGQPATRDYALPPPTLAFLITTLGTQAMVALGEVPNPLTGKLERLPNQAKHFIDTLAMLEEKTVGNRTPEESALLSSLLHQLRMAFVAAQSS
ncbi:MAG: DUF1844 domain-containing protein [Pirellulales bacterium]